MSKASTNKRKRIAIFTSNDKVWALSTWIRTIPNLINKHDVIGIYLFPDRLVKMRGIQSYFWYLKVFGFGNFFIMSIYSLKKRLRLLVSSIHSWQKFAERYNFQLLKANTPNSKTVIKWTKDNNIDIIFIMVGNILKESIIDSPNIGIINKHAAMLPSCKGIFPFFWGKLTNAPTGITFHQVDTGIDTGSILIQLKYPKKESNISMLRFYIEVYSLYPQLAELAVEKLIDHKYITPLSKIESSYFSLPTRVDYKAYRKRSFKITRFTDLFYQPNNPF